LSTSPISVGWSREGSVWTGQTEQIPKQVVPHGTRSVGEVLCSVDNAKLELLPNINVEVRIIVRKRAGVVIVPRAAVREEDGSHYVFVLSDDRLHRQKITVGVASASQYEVVAGLQVNDRVALPGDQDLRDGMEIQPTEAQ
jgi:multidrug efflux pump subunit AcrA (membrane-fusion protein)